MQFSSEHKGSHVNLCGRIESYTVGGQVLISPRTRSMIPEALDIAMEQEVFPKGVKAPLTLSQVTGLGGEYGVSCKLREEPLVPLRAPAPVRFVTIHEKHVDAQPSAGRFTALSRTGGVLETEAALERFSNIQIHMGGKLFAKVLNRTGKAWLLCFTSIPPEFDSWYKTVI